MISFAYMWWLLEKLVGNKNRNKKEVSPRERKLSISGSYQGHELLSEKSASYSSVCERFREVGVSRRGTTDVLECLLTDAQLN